MVRNTQNPLVPRSLIDLWLLPVLNSLNSPPANPSEGDRYRVTAVALGAWAGHENQIAIWDKVSLKWLFDILTTGMVWYDFTSNNWQYMSSAGVITQFDKIPLAISDVAGLQAALDGKASTAHQATHQSAGSDALAGILDSIARLSVSKNGGAVVGSRRKINLIEGANITLVIADDGVGEKTDVTITGAPSGSSFNDNVFNIFNNLDNTKIAKQDASLITTGITRTFKYPNANGTYALLDIVQTFLAALTFNDTLTSAKIGDVLIPSVDNQGNIGTNIKRFANVRAVTIQSGDLILSDKKTGNELYKIREDEENIYFESYKTGQVLMALDQKGNLKIAGRIKQRGLFGSLKNILWGEKTCQ